ncbi:STAS domain-containing protein [Streptomyces sp. SAS_260]|uniref:STAS domain-containing protein n=1 Tax=Streptomyces sp. SAS_260 TaxID=3412751 RepID=UPI00403D36C2
MHQSSSAWPIGHIHSQQVSGTTVIEFHGEIDIAAAQQILPDLDAATAAPGRTVVIDLGPVEFIDVYGLRLLRHAERRVTERHGWLLLVCPHPLILEILRAGDLVGRFTPLAALEEALDSPTRKPRADARPERTRANRVGPNGTVGCR